MKLDAMAVTMPPVRDHPNRVPFEGVLTYVDVRAIGRRLGRAADA